MTETKRRGVLEQIVGKPLPWLAWTWAALAVIWIVLAIVDPSGFHTFMAITWSFLAIVQLSAVYYARKQESPVNSSSRTSEKAVHSGAETSIGSLRGQRRQHTDQESR